MNRYFRATIDFTVIDAEDHPFTDELIEAEGIDTNDEVLGKTLEYNIGAGFVQIDAINNIEAH